MARRAALAVLGRGRTAAARHGAGLAEPAGLTARLRAQALSLGFADLGITTADAVPEAGQRLKAWLADGRHGDMIWMADRADERAAPKGLWPDVRSVVMLGTNYAPALDPLRLAGVSDTGVISVYAWNRDYHDLIKKRLKTLARWLVSEAGGDVKVFVDTAPVLEKPLAAAAGLGGHWHNSYRRFCWQSLVYGTLIYLYLTREESKCICQLSRHDLSAAFTSPSAPRPIKASSLLYFCEYLPLPSSAFPCGHCEWTSV